MPDPRLASAADAARAAPVGATEAQDKASRGKPPASYDTEELVSRLTSEVLAFLDKTK